MRSIHQWMETFPWESEEQQKGFSALVQFLRNLPAESKTEPESELPCVAAWFIQKDHESAEWFTKVLGERMASLEEQIVKLQAEVRFLNSKI